MIKKVYIDNYKSLVNFDFNPGPVQLILGANGAGKTSMFEALVALRGFLVEGGSIAEIFPPRTLTRWDLRSVQTFELTVERDGDEYTYRVEIEHDRFNTRARIKLERLTINGSHLYDFSVGEVQLYRDDFSVGPKFPAEWSRSGLFNVPSRHDNRKLSWFKSWMASLCCIQADTRQVRLLSDREESRPDRRLSNFASWFRHLQLEKPGAVHSLFESLKGVIEGFEGMITAQEGESLRALRVSLISNLGDGKVPAAVRYGLDELSDGQRMLIFLYTLSHCALEPGATLFIDDPVIHVAIREIQPWLTHAIDRADDIGSQLLLISHHPELIDYLAREKGIEFRREHNGPVRVLPYRDDPESGLPPSEQLARGWEDG